jgi:hypothetical protein
MNRLYAVLLLIVLVSLACSLPAPASDVASPTATAAPPPTETPDPFPNPVLKIVGQEQVVFDWTDDRCEPENIPDLAARAFRAAGGQVHLILSHYVNYQMLGPDLNNLTTDCHPVLRSTYNADPAAYDDSEWLAALYTEDGVTVYALVHNEYRGHTHPGMCPTRDYFDCLDTSLTLAVSTDSGMTYTEIEAPPGHMVARLPHPYAESAGPFGIRSPSNIIRGPDGYFYAFTNLSQYDTQLQWTCAMRATDLSDPRSWRYWNGSAFEGQFIDPYLNPDAPPAANTCVGLDRNNLVPSLSDSVTFNTYLNRYVVVGLSADTFDGREVWGIYYSFSNDLLHWKPRKLLAEMPLPWTVPNPGSDMSILYPALLDPDSDSRNFDTTGKTAYLYFTRMNHGGGSLDRDLIRVAVEFFP